MSIYFRQFHKDVHFFCILSYFLLCFVLQVLFDYLPQYLGRASQFHQNIILITGTFIALIWKLQWKHYLSIRYCESIDLAWKLQENSINMVDLSGGGPEAPLEHGFNNRIFIIPAIIITLVVGKPISINHCLICLG